MTHNIENGIILNNVKQLILLDTIAKFGFSLKAPEFSLHMIEYKAEPIHNFYKTFKKAKVYLDILNAKA